MKINLRNPRARQRGVSLLECLMYMAVMMVVLGVATYAFTRCWDDSKHLRQNANDIAQALHAGEQWRADVRQAAGPIQVTTENGAESVVIPVRDGAIRYVAGTNQITREVGGHSAVVLQRVKASHMLADARGTVAAWRWELELSPTQKKVRMQPLFTFEAVAGNNSVR